MTRSKRIASAVAGFSMVAALASPTFGVNLTFNAGLSTIQYFHDAEDGDPVNNAATTRELNIGGQTGLAIGSGSAPGFQLGSATVLQNGGAGTGFSQGRIGIGHVEDDRTATMTVQSLTFVNQNEVNTSDASLKMDGSSIIRATFSLVWDATGSYGPPLVGRISIPLSATLTGTGSAKVRLDNVQWLVDQAADGLNNGTAFEARTPFTGEVAFVGPGGTSTNTQTAILQSTSIILKKPAATTNLQMVSGDRFILSGTLTFFADGNSPADTQFQFGNPAAYETEVLADHPLRYYRLNEDNADIPAIDIGSAHAHGTYSGVILPAGTASFALGTGAQFPGDPPIETFSQTSVNSSNVIPQGLGDVIQAPHGPGDLNFAAAGDTNGLPFTVEAWVSPQEFLGFTPDTSLVDKQDGSGNGWRLAIGNNALRLAGGNGGLDALLSFPNSDDSFVPDQFYHIVAVSDGTGHVEFYVNGVSFGISPYALITNSGADLFLGNNITGDAAFVGILDEVAIYGTALTAADVLRHYNHGREDSQLIPIMGLVIDEAFDIPEPGTVTLTMLGVAAAAMVRRRRV
jgi:hypothetical protein